MPKHKPAIEESGDPLNVNARLYRQIARLLDDLEAADAEDRLTVPQRISALIAIGRIQIMFANLRKGEFSVGAGAKIRQYASAFAQNPSPRRRATHTRSADIIEFGDGSYGDSNPEDSDSA